MDVMCSWCHEMNSQNGLALTSYCIFCGHRADVPRTDCDCPKCWKPVDGVAEPQTPEHAAGLALARKLCAVEDQRDELLAALKALAHTTTGVGRDFCFCGVAIGHPMYRGQHSDACVAAVAAIKKAEGA